MRGWTCWGGVRTGVSWRVGRRGHQSSGTVHCEDGDSTVQNASQGAGMEGGGGSWRQLLRPWAPGPIGAT
eukprot:3690084-Pyramimonas_sp.AAC.2